MSFEAVVVVVLAGCLVGGGIGACGVLGGLLVGRRFREMPRIKCVATDWQLLFEKAPEGSRRAVCSFELDLFNEGLLATGVRGVSVVLHGEDGPAATARLKDSVSGEPLWSVELPPRRWAHVSASAVFEGEEARELEGFRRADLLGRFPDGGAFELTIVERKDFVASPKRTRAAPEGLEAEHTTRLRLLARRRRDAG